MGSFRWRRKGFSPTAPFLAMDPTWISTDNTPEFMIDVDDTVSVGDYVQLQIRTAGAGDWSTLEYDFTRQISDLENPADEISLTAGALSNGDKEARSRVIKVSASSGWSNTVPFTVAAVVLNRFMWGTDAVVWGTDNITWG